MRELCYKGMQEESLTREMERLYDVFEKCLALTEKRIEAGLPVNCFILSQHLKIDKLIVYRMNSRFTAFDALLEDYNSLFRKRKTEVKKAKRPKRPKQAKLFGVIGSPPTVPEDYHQAFNKAARTLEYYPGFMKFLEAIRTTA